MKTRFLFRMVSLLTILSMLLVGGGPGVRPAKAEGEQFILAAPYADFVHGYKWPLDTQVSMWIDDPATPEQVDFTQAVTSVPADWMADPFPVASFNFHGQYDLKVGDHITIGGSGISEEYTVLPFEITGINGETNTVSGIASPGVPVHICVDTGPGQCRWTVSDGTGTWTAPPNGWDDFVITPGLRFWGTAEDEHQNSTYQNTHLLNPTIGAWGADDRRVEAFDFAWDTPVTVSVYQDAVLPENLRYTDTQITFPAPWDTSVPWVQFMRPDGVEMTWGTIVVMEGGGVTRELAFSPIWDVSGSSKTDVITGQAAEGTPITVCLWNGWKCYTASRSGSAWTMDFVGIADLRPGDGMRITASEEDGDVSNLEFQLPNARIEASTWTNRYSLVDFAAGKEITVTIGEYSTTFTPDGSTNWYDFHPPVSLAPGVTITAENEDLRKELVIAGLRATTVDPNSRIAAGEAAPGSSFEINVDGNQIEHPLSRNVTVDSNGEWSIDLSESSPDAWTWFTGGGMWQWDEDGDNTYAMWHHQVYTLEAWPQQNRILANGYSDQTELTFIVDDPETVGNVPDFTGTAYPVRQTWYDGSEADIYLGEEIQLKAGMTVTVTDGITEKVMVIKNLKIQGADPYNEFVYGYAEPGDDLDITDNYYNPSQRIFSTGENGSWQVDYRQPSIYGDFKDINPGDNLYLYDRETDRDATIYIFQVRSPRIDVRAYNNTVEAPDWPFGDTLTLTVGGQDFFAEVVHPDNNPNETRANFYDLGGLDIVPGMEVTVTNGHFSKTTVVTGLEITDIDIENDTVSGVATPGIHTGVWACVYNGCFNRYPEVQPDGTWFADFRVPGALEDEQTIVDIVYGTWVDSAQWDDDSDATLSGIQLLNYNVYARANSDQVETYSWPLGDTLTLTINHQGEIHEFTEQVRTAEWDDAQTTAPFNLSNQYNIVPGDVLTVTNGEVTRTLTVTSLKFTQFDEIAETVAGTADPFSQVNIWACPDSNCYNRHLTADENGDWLADFANPGTQPDEQNTVDLVKGIWVDSNADETNGVATSYGRSIPNPRFDLRADGENVDGYDWPAGTTLTLTIDGHAEQYQVEVTYSDWNEENTHGGFYLGGKYDIMPGDVVTLSGGGISKTLVVNSLQFTEMNEAADTVSGIADPGSQVNIWACPGSSCYNRHVTADENGEWTADFANPGVQPDEQTTLDLVKGTGFDSNVVDDDSDATAFGRSVPNPRFDVRPFDDQVEAYEWPAGATLTLTVQGRQFESQVETTSMYGDTHAGFYLNGEVDIQAGDVITITDGVNTTSTTVASLRFSDFDAAADTVSGYADPGSWINIWACDDYGYCPNRWVQAGDTGRWTAGFATPAGDQGTQDIVASMWVDSRQWDDHGNNTMYGKETPWVGMYTFLSENRVDSCCWYGEETPELTISDPMGPFFQDTQTPGDDPWGVSDLWYVNFDLGEFTLAPGQEATLTYGGVTHTHTVQDLWVESYDLETGLITGHAPAGAYITGSFWADGGGGGEATADADGNWSIFLPDGAPYKPSTIGDVVLQDEDWDATVYNINMGSLFADPDQNVVELKNVPTHRAYTLAIDDPSTPLVDKTVTQVSVETGTGTVGTTGMVDFALDSYDLKPGDILTLTSGHDTRTLAVRPKQAATFHIITDQLDGIAQPNGVEVVGAWPGREVTADGSGLWSVDLTTASADLPALDLIPGASIPVYEYDVDGDLTVYTYTVPMPDHGSLTASGSITSPKGAIPANPAYTGKASFDISARYTTTGRLTGALQFNVKGLSFASTALDWLVVEGTRAQLAGQGKIAGKSGYSFLLSAAENPNVLRLRIWKTATGEVVYDSMPGQADWAVPVTPFNKGGSLKLAQ